MEGGSIRKCVIFFVSIWNPCNRHICLCFHCSHSQLYPSKRWWTPSNVLTCKNYQQFEMNSISNIKVLLNLLWYSNNLWDSCCTSKNPFKLLTSSGSYCNLLESKIVFSHRAAEFFTFFLLPVSLSGHCGFWIYALFVHIDSKRSRFKKSEFLLFSVETVCRES